MYLEMSNHGPHMELKDELCHCGVALLIGNPPVAVHCMTAGCRCDTMFSTGSCEDGTGRCICRPEYTGINCDRSRDSTLRGGSRTDDRKYVSRFLLQLSMILSSQWWRLYCELLLCNKQFTNKSCWLIMLNPFYFDSAIDIGLFKKQFVFSVDQTL